LIGNGVHFRPLGKIIHCNQEESASLVTPWEGPSYVDGYSLERGSHIILVHLAPIPGPRTATGCTGITLPAPFLNVGSCLEPIESCRTLFRVLLISRWPFSLWCIQRLRKLMELCNSFPIINFIVSCCSLNSTNLHLFLFLSHILKEWHPHI
jgi:hypothetical protein